jgi:hypothetical protein
VSLPNTRLVLWQILAGFSLDTIVLSRTFSDSSCWTDWYRSSEVGLKLSLLWIRWPTNNRARITQVRVRQWSNFKIVFKQTQLCTIDKIDIKFPNKVTQKARSSTATKSLFHRINQPDTTNALVRELLTRTFCSFVRQVRNTTQDYPLLSNTAAKDTPSRSPLSMQRRKNEERNISPRSLSVCL